MTFVCQHKHDLRTRNQQPSALHYLNRSDKVPAGTAPARISRQCCRMPDSALPSKSRDPEKTTEGGSMGKDISIDVWLDEKSYRAFAVFDRLVRTGSWKRPLAFLAVFVALAAISFIAAASGKQGALLLGSVLLLIGAAFPASHFHRFLSGLSQWVARLGLQGKNKRYAYTLAFMENPRALTVYDANRQPLTFPWKDFHGVWRRRGAVYLYAEAGKAYIVPSSVEKAIRDAAWDRLRQAVPKERIHDQARQTK